MAFHKITDAQRAQAFAYADTVRARLRAAHLPQRALAAAVGMQDTYLSRVLLGRTVARAKTIARIEAALDTLTGRLMTAARLYGKCEHGEWTVHLECGDRSATGSGQTAHEALNNALALVLCCPTEPLSDCAAHGVTTPLDDVTGHPCSRAADSPQARTSPIPRNSA